MSDDGHLRDYNCSWCNGEGSYWEQGPNSSTQCSQCNTLWNMIRGFRNHCVCKSCIKAKSDYAIKTKGRDLIDWK